MKSVSLREAETGLSALIDAVEGGENVTITRNGKPAAVLVAVAELETPSPPREKRDFVDFLLSYPGGIELERDQTPMRDIDF